MKRNNDNEGYLHMVLECMHDVQKILQFENSTEPIVLNF